MLSCKQDWQGEIHENNHHKPKFKTYTSLLHDMSIKSSYSLNFNLSCSLPLTWSAYSENLLFLLFDYRFWKSDLLWNSHSIFALVLSSILMSISSKSPLHISLFHQYSVQTPISIQTAQKIVLSSLECDCLARPTRIALY